MATYNGAKWLQAQMDSVAGQSHKNWRLLVSDDGSQDATPEILARFAEAYPEGQVKLLRGPCTGASANFRSLIARAAITGSVLAFCDQDDVWPDDHLARGLDLLSRAHGPLAIAGGRMLYTDRDGNATGRSPLPRRPLDFRNALVQNVLSGNTMMLSPAAAETLQAAEAEAGPILLHDWWAYQIITGAGGEALYDPELHVFYRQHGGNVVGSNRGLRALPARISRHLNGRYFRDIRLHLAALQASAHRFTPENRTRMLRLSEALAAGPADRITGILASEIRLQSRGAMTGFWLSQMFGRR